MVYVIAMFCIVFVLVASGLLLVSDREAMAQRLARVLTPGEGAASRPAAVVLRWAGSLGLFAGSLQRVVPRSQEALSAVQRRLVRAGLRDEGAVSILHAAKSVTPVLLCVIVTATGAYRWNPFIVFAGSIVLGYLIPDYVLDHLISGREGDIRRSLPDILDLLVVCLEAGLSLDQAVIRAVEEMRPAHPALADELGLVMLEVRAGRPRAAAWRSLEQRTAVDSIHLLVSVLIQADQFGTGISKTLRTHSETIRTRLTQYVEELAAKTTVKLIFPLVFFILPSLLVVTLGPALMIISDGLNM